MKTQNRWIWTCVAIVSALAEPCAKAATDITVATVNNRQMIEMQKLSVHFEKANPDVEIKWVRDSTGIITAKLLAEKSKPVADMVVGVAATSMVVFTVHEP